MISANQKFKQSGTTKSFKEWLADEQKKGELEVHNKQEFVNANGVSKPFSLSKANRNMLIVVGIGLLAYGYYRYSKNKG
tara:strand:- start:306 stop:542 length:237 start_codon:yes stop_codon:yes gene_type:complete